MFSSWPLFWSTQVGRPQLWDRSRIRLIGYIAISTKGSHLTYKTTDSLGCPPIPVTVANEGL